MSLRVWLPLNGDLKNQGLDDITVVNNGATIDNNGKIGKCYSFDGTDDYINLGDLNKYFKGNPFSITFWIKSEENGSRGIIFSSYGLSSTSNFFGLEINGSSGTMDNYLRFDWLGSDKKYFHEAVTYNTWVHLAVVYNGTTITCYQNGNYFDSVNSILTPVPDGNIYYLGRDVRVGSTAFKGRMNDFRIYDHALSLKEVKEISKGLIVHYPLNNSYLESSTNLITSEDCLSSTCYNGAINKYGYGTNTDMYKEVTTFDGKKGTKVYMGTNGASAYPYVYINNMFTSNGTNAPEYKTLSFDYYTTISKTLGIYKLGNGSGTAAYKVTNTTIKTGIGINSVSIPVEKNMWNHVEIVFHGTTDDNAQWGYIQNSPLHTSDTSNFWFFANMQLQEKDHATGYLGFGKTTTDLTVYDNSGYNNNSIGNKIKCETFSVDKTSILSNNIKNFNNWINLKPECVDLKNNGFNKNTYHLKQSMSGVWENAYSPAISVTANQQYTLSCIYKVYNDFTYVSGYGQFGLTVVTTIPTNANPYNTTIARIGFSNTASGYIKASVTFTPTVSTIYLNLCGGSISDGQYNKKFDINNIQLEQGNIASESAIQSVRYNNYTVFNGIDSYIMGQSISTQAQTATFWYYPTDISVNQLLFADYKSNLAFGIYHTYIPVSCMASGNYRKVYSKTLLSLNEWNFISIVKNTTDEVMELYINGILQTPFNGVDSYTGNIIDKLSIGARPNNFGDPLKGYLSDFRIYAAAFSAEDIKELYQITASIDRNSNFYTYEYNEIDQSNEIQYFHTWNQNITQDEDGLHLNSNVWINHGTNEFISINPTNKTYKYDIICSIDAGNQFYIGWERYDANKTSRSNNACIYPIATKPSADIKYKRYTGTVNLSTDGVNPTAFIKLRILNKWTGSATDTTGKATIHYFSLKEYSSEENLNHLNISKQGVTSSTKIVQNIIGTSISKDGQLHSNFFIEN